jgi:hypothetical protein
VVAFEVARAFRAKFSGDSLEETRAQFDAWRSRASEIPPAFSPS